jgi:D-alanine-D-alanine ligase
MGAKRRLRIGVIFGGRSGEHEVSLASASSVLNALDSSRYEIVPIGITQEGRWVSAPNALRMMVDRSGSLLPERFLVPEPGRRGLVRAGAPAGGTRRLDVVFPLVHGTFGEDGTVQGLLELADLPYIGAGVLASAVGLDKIVQKELFRQAGLPVVRSTWLFSSFAHRHPAAVVRQVESALRYPVFVKPANTGSSVGITKVHDRSELRPALRLAAAYDRKIIIEQGVSDAREIEVSVLGNDDAVASVPGEIFPSNEFYDYDAKYVDGKSVTAIPARLPRRTADRVRAIALEAFRTLDCSGMARVDFFVGRRTGKVTLNELNTIPGFTAISMYPKLWEASGLPFPRLLDRLVALALERHRQKKRIRTSFRPSRDWYKTPPRGNG